MQHVIIICLSCSIDDEIQRAILHAGIFLCPDQASRRMLRIDCTDELTLVTAYSDQVLVLVKTKENN